VLATKENLSDLIERFSKPGKKAVDTETTGLRAYNDDHLFSIILADREGCAYFNFQQYDGLSDSYVLPDTKALAPIFADNGSLWFAHNAKFDMAMLRLAGIEILAPIHCTLAMGRLVYNAHLSYDLNSLVKEIGLEKSSAVDEYINEHKLYEQIKLPGKEKRVKIKFFDRVPFSIISKYGLTDGTVTRALGLSQIERLNEIADSTPKNRRNILDVYRNEMALTKVLFEMEWAGFPIDAEYTERAAEHEEKIRDEATAEFSDLVGRPYRNSPKALAEAFDAIGEPYPRNPPTISMIAHAKKKGELAIGNPCFNKKALATMKTPAARIIKTIRAADKKAGTYYRSFLYFADKHDRIHANIRQSGTEHGRMSCADPNLQNLNKEKDISKKFLVRRSFIPPSGYFLAMIDYDQMEYRLMMDYAGELAVIQKVLGGLDLHTATAEMMDTDRDRAKTLNFLLLYGGGATKLAGAVGCTIDQAYELKRRYFSSLPNVERFIRQVIRTASQRGFIFNWMGRRCHFPNPEFAYAAPNHLIAGGCADIVKAAMLEESKYLAGRKSYMLMQVHDELVFAIHESEANILPDLQNIMETVYPHKYLPLTAGISHSFTSWADKIDGPPK